MSVKETKRKPLPLTKALLDITVGIHTDDGAQGHSEGLSIADIGTFHEFGTATVPMRSFIRGWYDENPEFIRATLKRELTAAAQGKRTVDQALERAALIFEGAVKQRIARNIPPPLAPATVARKGSSVALIDTGQLRNAIRGRVKGSDGNGG
jgi:hypothetical protein